MTRAMRVKRFGFKNKFQGWQLLQEKRWWGWATLDREEIPHCVLVSLGAFGDTGGWKSKFCETGTFGRDGAFTPHDPSTYAREPGRIAAAFKRLLTAETSTSSREARA